MWYRIKKILSDKNTVERDKRDPNVQRLHDPVSNGETGMGNLQLEKEHKKKFKQSDNCNIDCQSPASRQSIARNPNGQLLQDRVSYGADMERLKLEEVPNKKLNQSDHSRLNYINNIDWQGPASRAIKLRESIARKLFPPEEFHQSRGRGRFRSKQAKYADRVMINRLMNEVVLPLKKAHLSQDFPEDEPKDEPCAVKTYLEKLKNSCCYSGGQISSSDADALLPHEITGYVHDRDLGHAAEFQWKSMVDGAYLKQGKLKNWLAVCDVNSRFMDQVSLEVSIALGLLVSELSEEPWKGKVMNFSRKPWLRSIQGGDNLSHKHVFLRNMRRDEDINFEKVFDLVLQVALNGNLKLEQMLNKVLVLTHLEFDDSMAQTWEMAYRTIHSKYKEKGYGDAVPHMIFWTLSHPDQQKPVVARTQSGVSILTGFSKNLLKMFLDSDGEIGPHHLMELAISGERYQGLTVVD